jgi:hypothetical protein
MGRGFEMVGPNGLEPSTSSVSRKRSNQTELRAYSRRAAASILTAGGRLRQRLALGLLGPLGQWPTNQTELAPYASGLALTSI